MSENKIPVTLEVVINYHRSDEINYMHALANVTDHFNSVLDNEQRARCLKWFVDCYLGLGDDRVT